MNADRLRVVSATHWSRVASSVSKSLNRMSVSSTSGDFLRRAFASVWHGAAHLLVQSSGELRPNPQGQYDFG